MGYLLPEFIMGYLDIYKNDDWPTLKTDYAQYLEGLCKIILLLNEIMDSEVPSGKVSTVPVMVVIAVDDSSQAEYAFDCSLCPGAWYMYLIASFVCI